MNSYDDIDQNADMIETTTAAFELSEDISSFYDQQYEDAEQHIPPHRDYGDEEGERRSHMHSLNLGNDSGDTFDDQIETIALKYDMGISKETKLCSRWCRRCFSCLPCCRRSYEIAGDGLDDTPSNEELLSIAFISFLCFTIAQAIAAYFARSEAMMGDSIAMGVDAFTYGFNLIAERMKNRADVMVHSRMELEMQAQRKNRHQESTTENEDGSLSVQENADTEKKIQRAKRKLTLILELVPPLISVITLISVTAYILHEAVTLLVLDSQRDTNLQDEPDVIIMFVFSFLNLVVDGINICFFSKADHAFGYDTFEDDIHRVETLESGSSDGSTNTNDNPTLHKNENGHATDTSSITRTGGGPGGFRRSSDNVNASSPSKRRGAKKKIADNFKHIIRERKRRKGGAYATVGSLDEEDEEIYYDGLELELSKSSEVIREHDNSNFSIGADDDDDEDDNEEFTIKQNGLFPPPNAVNHSDTRFPPLSSTSSIDEEIIQDQFERYNSQKGTANLNMCSAYTHVFADTVRSVAVLIASLLGKYVDVVTPEVADAAAAVVVSLIILIALIPLLSGMVKTTCELITIRREEVRERIMNKHPNGTGIMI